MARPEAAPRHVKKNTNHRNAALRFLHVLHIFHVTRVATAAAFVLVRRTGVIFHRVLLLQVARVATARAATVFVRRRHVILQRVLLLHIARIAATCTAIVLIGRSNVILHCVLLRHVARVTATRATTRVDLRTAAGLRRALRKGDAGDCHRQPQHANYLSKRIHDDDFSYRKEMIA